MRYDHGSRQTFEATSIRFDEVDEGALYSQPALTLDEEGAQRLMDDLWTEGVRPSERFGTAEAGALGEAREHISTLRKIAFKLAKVTPLVFLLTGCLAPPCLTGFDIGGNAGRWVDPRASSDSVGGGADLTLHFDTTGMCRDILDDRAYYEEDDPYDHEGEEFEL